MTKAETVGFLAARRGIHNYGDVTMQADTFKVMSDTVEVKFDEPFPEGVIPVVVTELRPTFKTNPMMTRVWDVTNEGFKCTATYEKGVAQEIRVGQVCSYIAVTPGQGKFADGKVITAGFSKDSLYGKVIRKMTFDYTDANGNETTYLIQNPILFGGLQECKLTSAPLLRMQTYTSSEEQEDGNTYYNGVYVKRQPDLSDSEVSYINSSTGEKFGYVIISDDHEYTTSVDEKIIYSKSKPTFQAFSQNGIIIVEDVDDYEVYSINGVKVAANATQAPGVYIVRSGDASRKVVVK
jgi:hypothetical protein